MKTYFILIFSYTCLLFGSIQAQTLSPDSTIRYTFTSVSDSVYDTKQVCTYARSDESVDCYDFSSCVLFAWDTDQQEWKPASKEERHWGNDDGYESRISYKWMANSKKWRLTGKMEYLKKADLKSSCFSKWDTLRNKWIEIAMAKQTFGRHGKELSSMSKRYDSPKNIFGGTLKSHRYDAEDRHIEQVDSYWKASIQDWYPQSKVQWTFDDNGQHISTQIFNYDSIASTWIPNQTFTFQYDLQGNLSWRAIFYHDEYPIGSKWVFRYDESGRKLSSTQYNQASNSVEWIVSDQTLYEYDLKGNLAVETKMTWQIDPHSWEREIREYRDLKSYDEQSRLIKSNRQRWNKEQKTWESWVRDTSSYTANGQLTQWNQYVWDSLLGNWKMQTNYEYEYVDDSLMTYQAHYARNPKTNVLEGRTKNIAAFDSEGQKTMGKRFVWDRQNQAWRPHSSKHQYWSACPTAPPTASILLYPNPVRDGFLHLQSTQAFPKQYDILSIDGRTAMQGVLTSLDDKIAVHDLPDGIYVFYLMKGEESVGARFIVRHEP